MGGFLRKYVSRRLLVPSEGEIAALTTSMRQILVGTPGGAEALGIFHQLIYDEWMTGSLSEPLARIKVDEKNCFGMIEWKAVREAASRFLPVHSSTSVETSDDPAEEQRLRADHAARVQGSVNVQRGGTQKLTGAHNPQHAWRERRFGRSVVHGRR